MPIRALVASAKQAKASPEAPGALAASATPMTALGEPPPGSLATDWTSHAHVRVGRVGRCPCVRSWPRPSKPGPRPRRARARACVRRAPCAKCAKCAKCAQERPSALAPLRPCALRPRPRPAPPRPPARTHARTHARARARGVVCALS